MNRRAKIIILLVFLALSLSLGGIWLATPAFDNVMKSALGSDQVLYGRDGKVLQTLRTDFTKRRLAWLPLSAFPEAVVQAIVSAEDRRFHHHIGIDPIGSARAAWAMIRHHPVQGASTITMQVADLIQQDVLLRNRPIKKGSLLHKAWQTLSAIGLELRWSKIEILEAYLNLIHLRGEFQGVPAASFAFLNKDPLALDPAEGIAIAAMISSPNQSEKALRVRACAIKKRMELPGDCEDVFAAASAFFQGSPSLPTQTGSAPHLAQRLFRENKGQSVVHSTIDAKLQQAVAAILEKNVQRLRNSNVHDSAAIVIENKTGKVLAYVGTVSSSQFPHVDGVQAYRQAGSALKPFFYGKAIELKRITAASIMLDDPTAISWGKDVYRPANYDKNFYGPVSVREALGSSLNVPAVKTVLALGLHESYKVLQSIHLSNLRDPDFYGVSMALGAVEVRLEDLANAYRTFANAGFYTPLQYIDQDPAKPEKIYGPETSYVIGSILSDPNARSIGFGWDSPLETPFWTAVKTGTSKDYRDNWCVGFSEHYTVGVWTGNFNAEAMEKVSGVSGAGPSWYDIMVHLHLNLKSSAPAMPAGVTAKSIRHQWGTQETKEYFLSGTEPVGNVVEPVLIKRAQFVFPAEGSVLVMDPHQSAERIALFVRYKGTVAEGSRLLLDGKELGKAASPFKITKLTPGNHQLAIRSPEGAAIADVRFKVKGAE